MTIAVQNVHFLNQGLDLLYRLDDDILGRPGQPGGGASVGAHLRHIIDCFRCFLRGLEAQRIDYDGRERDPRIESSADVAAGSIAEIIDGLNKLTFEDTLNTVEVKVDAAAWGESELQWSASSVGRELQFLLSHTVHHYALIAMILRGHGIDPTEDFGVAPSTIAHRSIYRTPEPAAQPREPSREDASATATQTSGTARTCAR